MEPKTEAGMVHRPVLVKNLVSDVQAEVPEIIGALEKPRENVIGLKAK